MKLTQLSYFQTICKYNNITRAAAELHISQPSLSGAIKELETEFGVPLFYRLNKGLALTEEGKVLLSETDKLLEQAEHLTASMNALKTTDQTIKLGVPPMLATLIFPRLLQAFHTAWPEINLQMVENGSLTNRNMVSDGTLDAAIISSAAAPQPSFGCCDLSALEICFYVSNRHPLSQNASIRPEDADGIPLALLTEDTFLADCLTGCFRALHLSPNIIVNTNQINTIWQLVENNAAATFLYRGLPGISREVAQIPVEGLPAVTARLIWNTARPLPAGVKNLIRLAEKGF